MRQANFSRLNGVLSVRVYVYLILIYYSISNVFFDIKFFSMKNRSKLPLVVHFNLLLLLFGCTQASSPDLILLNGKIITIDQKSTIAQAVAVKNDKIISVGSNDEIRKLAGSQTKIIDVKGKVVIPGLNDAHAHPEAASVSELDFKIPDLNTIGELLSWIKSETKIRKRGEWIILPTIFFTRLKELRQPLLEELDSVAPLHPVFLDGSYGGMINSCAMQVSHIAKDTDLPGFIKDKKTHKLTGFVRTAAFNLIKLPKKRQLSFQEALDALQVMLSRYNSLGITSVCSGYNEIDFDSEGMLNSDVSSLSSGYNYKNNFKMYQDLRKSGKLTVRVFQNIEFPQTTPKSLNAMLDSLKALKYSTGAGDEWIRIGALKILLDGGILTGTALMREPWGVKAQMIFGINDPTYCGVVNYTREDLLAIVKAANELNWKFTAHCTGGGGVDLLLDVYDEVNKIKPIKERRFSIIHANFFTKEAMEKMKRLGVYADMQPAWFYKDADAMKYILGDERIKTFQNYRSLIDGEVMVNGGSDHMVKMDANTSSNPYNPFLAMWSIVTRTTERGTVILPEEAISREEALRMYTINNAFASFEESIKGSIEPGKLADMAILTDDILTCPVDKIKDIKSEMTIVGGKIVYASGKGLSH